MELFGVFSAFGLSASAGLNAYIPLLVLALLAKFSGMIHLNPPWDGLTSWWIIGLLCLLSLVEFFADKIPAVNHVNDIIQTFIRPTAGAIAFAASAHVVSDVHPILALAAGVLIAGSVHVVKAAAVRPAITATTGGAANVPVSIAEDLVSTLLSVVSVVVPVLVACIMIMLTAWGIWLLWRRVNRTKRSIQN
jgi:hypothetical protein